MNIKKSALIAFVAITALLACLLCSCAKNPVEVVNEPDGSVTFTAENGGGISETTIEVGPESDYLEIHADLESGDMIFVLTGENSEEYGTITFDSTRARSELVEVNEGTVNILLNAHDATGTAHIRGVVVLDGPGTAGS